MYEVNGEQYLAVFAAGTARALERFGDDAVYIEKYVEFGRHVGEDVARRGQPFARDGAGRRERERPHEGDPGRRG